MTQNDNLTKIELAARRTAARVGNEDHVSSRIREVFKVFADEIQLPTPTNKIARLEDMPQYECSKDDNSVLDLALLILLNDDKEALMTKERARALRQKIKESFAVIIVEDK